MWRLALALAVALQGTFHSSTNVVPLYVTVTNHDGATIAGLNAAPFTIYDNGQPQPIAVFSSDAQPFTADLLLDLSNSMKGRVLSVKAAAQTFVDALGRADRAAIGPLGTSLLPLTADRDELRRAIDAVPDGGPSPIWDSVDGRCRRLLNEPEPRVIVALTDGEDSRYANTRPVINPLDAMPPRPYPPDGIADRVRSADCQLFVVSFKGTIPSVLFDLVRDSGGTLTDAGTTARISAAFAAIVDQLHHRYLLGFVPAARDGKLHRIEVRVAIPGALARTRKSYVSR